MIENKFKEVEVVYLIFVVVFISGVFIQEE